MKVGDSVTVIGTTNSDGSVTAQTVMDGMFGRGRGFGGLRPSDQPMPTGKTGY